MRRHRPPFPAVPARPALQGVVVFALLLMLAGVPATAQEVPDTLPPDQLRTVLETRITRSPQEPGPWVELARLEARMGNLDQAESLLAAGLDRIPANTELRRALVELLVAREDWGGVDRVLAGWPGPLPEDLRDAWARIAYNQAVTAVRGGRVEEGRARFREARARSPGLVEAWRLAIRLELQAGQLDAAAALMADARELHPDDPELRLIGARILAARKGAPEAIDELRELRRLDPTDLDTALALSAALASGGRMPQSLALQDTLLSEENPDVRIFEYAAAFWSGYGLPDSAAVRLERGVRLHPGAESLRVLLAWAAGEAADRRGDRSLHEQSARAWREAARMVDEPAWLLLRTARREAAAGDTVAAVEALRDFQGEEAPLVARLMAAEDAEGLGAGDLAEWLLRRAALRWPDETVLRETEWRVLSGREEFDPGPYMDLLEDLVAAGSPAGALAWLQLHPQTSFAKLEDEGAAVLRSGIRGGLAEQSRREMELTVRMPAGTPSVDILVRGDDLARTWVRQELQADRKILEELLDRMMSTTGWGPGELERLLTIYPDSPELRLRHIRRLLADGSLDSAQTAVRQFMDRSPRNSAVHVLHGRILEARDRPEAALGSYGRALEMDAGAVDAYTSLVRLHRDQATLDRLLERIRRLRRLAPRDTLRLQQELELLQRMGRSQEARDLADRLESLRGSDGPGRGGAS